MPMPRQSSLAAAVPPLAALAFVALNAVLPALAEGVPFRPDEAILACQARSTHAIAAESGTAPRPEGRFETEAMDRRMWHVSGVYIALFDGERRRLAVDCDVSAEGVEVFTMAVEPKGG
ncbi:MAG: hypothetical protein AAFZ09_17125 [Pseudomonadota bacterium]